MQALLVQLCLTESRDLPPGDQEEPRSAICVAWIAARIHHPGPVLSPLSGAALHQPFGGASTACCNLHESKERHLSGLDGSQDAPPGPKRGDAHLAQLLIAQQRQHVPPDACPAERLPVLC